MGEAFDEQLLLINFAPGGHRLHVNFRPRRIAPLVENCWWQQSR